VVKKLSSSCFQRGGEKRLAERIRDHADNPCQSFEQGEGGDREKIIDPTSSNLLWEKENPRGCLEGCLKHIPDLASEGGKNGVVQKKESMVNGLLVHPSPIDRGRGETLERTSSNIPQGKGKREGEGKGKERAVGPSSGGKKKLVNPAH